MNILLLGGSKSGKSALAQQLTRTLGPGRRDDLLGHHGADGFGGPAPGLPVIWMPGPAGAFRP